MWIALSGCGCGCGCCGGGDSVVVEMERGSALEQGHQIPLFGHLKKIDHILGK